MKQDIWVEPVGGGMHQKTLSTLIDRSEAQFLYNFALDRLGSWVSRLGYKKVIEPLMVGDYFDCLATYELADGTQKLMFIIDSKLYELVGTTPTVRQTGYFTSGFRVHSCNFLDRIYFFSEDPTVDVCYWDGSSLTKVGAGGNEMYAKFGAVAQDIIWMAVDNLIYASKWDETTFERTDQMYDDGDSFATSKRLFEIDGNITSLISFKDNLLAFTENSCWSMNIQTLKSLAGPVKLFDIGTVAHRTVQIDNKYGFLMFAHYTGVYLWSGAGDPINVSDKVQDEFGTGFWDLVSDFSNLAAGLWNGKYYLSVGDLSDSNLDYSELAGLVYYVNSNKVSIWNLPSRIFTKFKINNRERLVFARRDADFILQVDGKTDNQDDIYGNVEDIVSWIITKTFRNEFGLGKLVKNFLNFALAYKSTETVELSYLTDNRSAFTKITDIRSSSSKRRLGQVNMGSFQGHEIEFKLKKTAGYLEVIGFGVAADVQQYTQIAGD